jgi:NAD(P)-dependent dehydrogenase (short-subunit alcohol dehydrogenase family)
MSFKTWFITGASGGLGREWAIAALERGDRVAGAARGTGPLRELAETYGDALLPIGLDVRDRAAVFAAVEQAHSRFGRLDVIVNCAGYARFGVIEELTEEEARDLMDTNFFGALWVTQAALPYLRDQGGGHLLQVSSVGGLLAGSSMPIYHASKWALEGLSSSLALQVAEFGIKVTIIEPTGYRTRGTTHPAESTRHPSYANEHRVRAERRAAVGSFEGDPRSTRAAVLEVVDAEDPPLRLLLGPVLEIVEKEYAARLEMWRAWEPTSRAAHVLASAVQQEG